MTEIAAMAGCATATIRRLLELDGVPRRPSCRRPPPESGITREWLEHEYTIKLRSIETLARERGVTAYYLMSLARNWGLPIRPHSQFSGIGQLELPTPPSPAMRAVTMRKGALGRLELITRIPGHDTIAAAARILYDGRASALVPAPQDRNSRRIHHHRPIRQAAGPHGGRPRVHLRSVPDPPDRPRARRPAGLPAAGWPEPIRSAPGSTECITGRRAGVPVADAGSASFPSRQVSAEYSVFCRPSPEDETNTPNAESGG